MSHALDDLLAKLIARIEAGAPPWRQPWSAGGDPGLPRRATGEPFTGSNAWSLAFAGAMAGRASPYWFTFPQALAIGAPVRKGERSSPALLYRTSTRPANDAAVDPAAAIEAGQVRRYTKVYAVFNAEQLSDCPEGFLAGPPIDEELRRASRDAVLDAVPATVVLGGGRAFYSPSKDVVTLPPPERFESVDDFRATKAHELVHWTGAARRLNRDFGRRFGDQAYAFEELVAEIGAALLGLTIGLRPQTLDGHAAYLAHWVAILKARPHALLEASGLAQKAVDHLLAYGRETPVAEVAGGTDPALEEDGRGSAG